MITPRPADQRGHAHHGWLDTRHTFSFGNYHDPDHMGFKSLRVINEDVIAGNQGFGTHPHRDMEILTYLVSGELEHQDSLGNGSVIRPGELQRMTAGTGVTHSEFNPSGEPTHLYQIWILPEQQGLNPGYEQKAFTWQKDSLQLVASRDGREGSLIVHQDVDVLKGQVTQGFSIARPLERSGAWIQMIDGRLNVNGHEMSTGDGLAIESEPEIRLQGIDDSHFLLFDLN